MTGAAGQGSGSAQQDAASRRRPVATLAVLALCAALAFAGLVALGTWQVHRLHWKHALIERVERRVHAAPVAAPGPERWPQVTAEGDEYRHVRLTGTFLFPLTTRVQASTELGSGYWLLTPLRDGDGNVVLVNRGFVPAGTVQAVSSPGQGNAGESQRTVTGLLRISEPGGGFLRQNDPAANRWYSRDVRAIAAARGLSHVAPFFVDADAGQPTAQADGANDPASSPVGGLTVIAFHDSHMAYALTWYALALMVLGAALRVGIEERRLRSRPGARFDGIGGENHYGRQE